MLPLKDSVPFPDTLTPLAMGQERSIRLVNDVLGGHRMLVMVASKDPEADNPGPTTLYDVGVAGIVARMLKVPDGTLRILVQGAQRVKLNGFVAEQPYLVAEIEELPDVVEPSPELEALFRNVQTTFAQIIEELPYLPEELQMAVANIDDPSELAHMIAGALRLKTEEKQALLEERDVTKRLRRLSELLARELEVISIGSKIQSQVQSEMDKAQREWFLRQQLKAIQEELGEVDESMAEADELREQLEQAELPDYARKQAERELSRLERLPPQAAEHGVIRTYLEWLATLPWSKSSEDDLDLKKARTPARQGPLRHGEGEGPHPRVPRGAQAQPGRRRSSILCFVGPPGRGQDLARASSVANTHGPQVRAHLGGRRARRVRDPRPPPHLHRRDARHDHPLAARRRHQQPGADDRRDRQDGRGLPRRPGQRDARGARPRAEHHLPGPLPGPAVRPLPGVVHHARRTSSTRSRPRCATAWR